jgi:deoxycytidine triphosphate deaminase
MNACESGRSYPKPAGSGFWSGETLCSRLAEVIESPDHNLVEYNTYLLAIGREIYVTPAGDKDAQTRTKYILKDRESYAIPPGQLALNITKERVTVPPMLSPSSRCDHVTSFGA